MTERGRASAQAVDRSELEAKRAAWFAELVISGDEQIRNRLVESYAPLAEFFAKRYQKRGVESEDLRQVAQLALVRAVDRFDPSFGVQFSTFAGRTIDGELKRYFRDKAWSVRVPRSLKERSSLVRSASEAFSTEHGRSPTVAELAAALEMDEDDVLEALDVQGAYRAASLDAPAGSEDGHMAVVDTLGADDVALERTDLREAVSKLLETLPERERQIVELRFFNELSQSEIAERVGVSQMHVSRLLRRSLDQLRAYMIR